jgi:hypothetical protein
MFRITRTVAAITVALGAVSLTHCSSGDPLAAGAASGGEGGMADDVSCVGDSRVDTYAAKLDKPGTRGVLSFELTSSEPAPPAKGSNTFELRILDADGVAVQGELSIALDMPDHGHGTSVTPVITFDAASGVYTIAPVYLFMPGVWRIALDFDADPDVTDHALFFFCIEG